jgi:phenolic acid decarboxylase
MTKATETHSEYVIRSIAVYLEKRGKNKEDVIQRIKEAEVMFNNKTKLICSNSLSLEITKKLIKSCIWVVAA